MHIKYGAQNTVVSLNFIIYHKNSILKIKKIVLNNIIFSAMARRLGSGVCTDVSPKMAVSVQHPSHLYAAVSYVCALNRTIGWDAGNAVDLHPLDTSFLYPVKLLENGSSRTVLLAACSTVKAMELSNKVDKALERAREDCPSIPKVDLKMARQDIDEEEGVLWKNAQRPRCVESVRDAWMHLAFGDCDFACKVQEAMDHLTDRVDINKKN